MHDRWREFRLGDLITKRTDFTIVDPANQYVVLGVQRSGWGFVERAPIYGSDTKFTKLMKLELENLVYRTITAFEAPSAVVGPQEVGHFVTPQTFPVFKIDDSQLLPGYMSLLTTWPNFHEAMASRCTGTVLRRKTLAVHGFASIPVSLPPLDEQRRIVDLIQALDGTIAAADASAQAMLSARASICSAVQEGAELVTLQALAMVSQGKSLPQSVQGQTTGSIPWFKIADMAKVQNLHGYIAAETSLSLDDVERIGGRVVPAGAVVFPRVGAAVLTEKKRLLLVDGALDENHLILTPRDDAPSELLLAVIENLSLSKLIQSGAVPSLNMALIRNTRVAWPTKDLEVYEEVFGQARRVAAAAGKAARHLRGLRSDLLAALLSGAHEIPQSYNEVMEA